MKFILGNYLFVGLQHRTQRGQTPTKNEFAGTSINQPSILFYCCFNCFKVFICIKFTLQCFTSWREQLAQHRVCTTAFLPYRLVWLMFRFPPRGARLVPKGRRDDNVLRFQSDLLTLSFKPARRWITSILFCRNRAALTNFRRKPTFLFSFIFWILFGERLFVLGAHCAEGGHRSGWNWQGFSVLLKDTLADWVLAILWAWSPASLPCNPNRWQWIWTSNTALHWIFLSYTCTVGASKERLRVVNDSK